MSAFSGKKQQSKNTTNKKRASLQNGTTQAFHPAFSQRRASSLEASASAAAHAAAQQQAEAKAKQLAEAAARREAARAPGSPWEVPGLGPRIQQAMGRNPNRLAGEDPNPTKTSSEKMGAPKWYSWF